MQRKRDSLIPISEVMADLPGPVQALRGGLDAPLRGVLFAIEQLQLQPAAERGVTVHIAKNRMAPPCGKPTRRSMKRRTVVKWYFRCTL